MVAATAWKALAQFAMPRIVLTRMRNGKPTRRRLVQGSLAALLVSLSGVLGSQQVRAESVRAGAETPSGLSVLDFGAIGDGSTNDSAAILRAINAAAGSPLLFPSGHVFVLDNVLVKATADLVVESGATLLARPNMGNNAMFNFTGTELSLRGGGTIDGNKSHQSGRPFVIVAAIPAGVVVRLDGLVFRNTVASVLRGSVFGGLVSITNCSFTGQAEHDGVSGHSTTIMTIISGQRNCDGVIRFNHNTCSGTITPALPGGGPGGIFVATNGYAAGSPGSSSFSDGNLSTLEAIGNYFYGYGQNCGGNDISPIHTYPAIGGARVIGNYFEKCRFAPYPPSLRRTSFAQEMLSLMGKSLLRTHIVRVRSPICQATTLERLRGLGRSSPEILLIVPGGSPSSTSSTGLRSMVYPQVLPRMS